MTTEKFRIGWIGAGKMGLPIAKRLKDAGHSVALLARTDKAKAKIEDMGLVAKTTIAAVCQEADLVFSSISDDVALIDIVCSKGGVAETLRKGGTYIDISTVSPDASSKVAERLQQAGIVYLRSPVSGSTTMAEAGTLTAVVSGRLVKFEELQPIFGQFARKSFHVGEAEEARSMKLVLNSMVAATSALLAEALAFGTKGGLDLATMLDVINQSVVASPLIAYKTDMIVKGDYRPAATLSMLQKDVDLFLATGSKAKINMPLSTLVSRLYREASERGLGEQDFFVLVQDALKHNK
jgi:3-hydroxyisobutyrate dehydrogenase